MSEPAPRFTRDEVVDMLARGPERIAAATTGITDADLLAPLEDGGWSARDVLGHMRACQQTWGGYIGRILDEDHPAFRAESPRSTIRRTDFLTMPFGRHSTASSPSAPPSSPAFERPARSSSPVEPRVKLVGRGAEDRSAFHYAHRLAEHELEHVAQIERAMAARRGP